MSTCRKQDSIPRPLGPKAERLPLDHDATHDVSCAAIWKEICELGSKNQRLQVQIQITALCSCLGKEVYPHFPYLLTCKIDNQAIDKTEVQELMSLANGKDVKSGVGNVY
ncbi:hypothetical protein ElyMa_000862300 [Elysia marginata]|uniref:Uncharacterized protein n=1 Tax=Elysia marginata TaxID=1093978 RepID=A0AAV4H396_9GAST|nr:hypothetical protein ElyMa_000862300 [Elysia marginata]